MNDMQQIDCPPLLEKASPDIYRQNLFRILELQIDVTPQDVQRQQKMRQMRANLQVAAAQQGGGGLALKPPPSDDEVRTAGERLNRPIDRLLDEIFWFWPLQTGAKTDPALKAVSDGKVEAARKLWKAAQESADQAALARHNLAVLEHLLVLDEALREDLAKLDRNARQQHLLQSRRSLDLWHEVVESDLFWQAVRERIRERNDAQLTSGFARRIRNTLPSALLLIGARLALMAAERGDSGPARDQIRMLRSTKFGSAAVDEAVRTALDPLRQRVRAAVERAKEAWEADPRRGAEHVRSLHEQASLHLGIVENLLPVDDLTRIALADSVAEAMLSGQIAYGRKTEDWAGSLELLKLAKRVAAGSSMKSRLDENVQAVEDNHETGNDWCSAGYWDLPEETVAELEALREKVRAGEFEATIAGLLALGAADGEAPLRRCLSHALSRHGIKLNNDAQSAFSPNEVLDKILQHVSDMDHITWRFPDPNAHTVPMCPHCLRSDYNSWVRLTYKDIEVFMCEGCSQKHNANVQRERTKLWKEVEKSLEYILLADEIDPGDKGVERILKSAKEVANDLDGKLPNTRSLRRRLKIGKPVRSAPAPKPSAGKVQPAPAKRTDERAGGVPWRGLLAGAALGLCAHWGSAYVPVAGDITLADALAWRVLNMLIEAPQSGLLGATREFALSLFLENGWSWFGAGVLGSAGVVLGVLAGWIGGRRRRAERTSRPPVAPEKARRRCKLAGAVLVLAAFGGGFFVDAGTGLSQSEALLLSAVGWLFESTPELTQFGINVGEWQHWLETALMVLGREGLYAVGAAPLALGGWTAGALVGAVLFRSNKRKDKAADGSAGAADDKSRTAAEPKAASNAADAASPVPERSRRDPAPAKPARRKSEASVSAPRSPRPSPRSSGAAAGGGSDRASIVKRARTLKPQTSTPCPVCGASVLARNLVRHFDKNHATAG